MSSNVQPLRPVTGVWPPCPPPPCPPSDCFGMGHLEKCYADVKRAQEFLKQMIKDIIACDPSIIGGGMPIVGVTDGSDAQPGMVGEWIEWNAVTPYPVASMTSVVSLGVLPPGDWDCWYACWFDAGVNDAQVILATWPIAGFSGDMGMFQGAGSTNLIASYAVRALTSVPTLVPISIGTNLVANGPAAGNSHITFMSRRRR